MWVFCSPSSKAAKLIVKMGSKRAEDSGLSLLLKAVPALETKMVEKTVEMSPYPPVTASWVPLKSKMLRGLYGKRKRPIVANKKS